MKVKQILFTKVNTAEFLDLEIPMPGPDEVQVKTAVHTISCGTERANITGSDSVGIYGGPNVTFPRHCGYSSSGTVTAVGEHVTDVKAGDRVAVLGYKYQSYQNIPQEAVIKIPDGVSFETASMAYITTFPMAAVRKTRIEVGEPVLIMGLGILGLFSTMFARLAGGTPVVVADPVQERRELALSLGADYAFDPTEPDFADKVKSVTDGGAAAAIEVTGVGAGLNSALDCMRSFGRVALLGCTRKSDFTIDYYRKVHGPGITLIGAHTLARPLYESHPGYFTTRDDAKAFFKLCELGRMDADKLVMETHDPRNCTEVFTRLINDKNFPPISQFDWRNI
ncbi:MAG: zinc-binding dehydrogenase [Clostridia bacterium]|nr:zinc-binding dehydrogenase [Clostridia bacterium]